MTNSEPIDWDVDVQADNEEIYESLVRAIARTKGFGLFFVRCVEKDRANLEQRLRDDLPRLRLERLELQEDLKDGNLYRRVAEVEQQLGSLNGLFISGLEKSLDPYVKSGYGGLGDYYNKDTVPRVLGHLNLQRERFRDDFQFCLIFFLSAFGIKYFARRAPDFFDWQSGLFEFVTNSEMFRKLTREFMKDYDKYLIWTEQQRLDHICKIQELLDGDRQLGSFRYDLFLAKRNILCASQNYKEAVASYDKAIEFNPDHYLAWYNHGNAIRMLNRDEEAIISYGKAIELKPDYHIAWISRGIALKNLNRYEEAISSYDKAIKIKADSHQAWYNRGMALGQLNRYEEAIASYDQAIKLKPDYHLAWGNRGITYCMLNRHEQAIVSYDKVIELKPDDHLAWYNRACANCLQGKINLAVADLTEAFRLNSEKCQKFAVTDSRLNILQKDSRFKQLLEFVDIQ